MYVLATNDRVSLFVVRMCMSMNVKMMVINNRLSCNFNMQSKYDGLMNTSWKRNCKISFSMHKIYHRLTCDRHTVNQSIAQCWTIWWEMIQMFRFIYTSNDSNYCYNCSRKCKQNQFTHMKMKKFYCVEFINNFIVYLCLMQTKKNSHSTIDRRVFECIYLVCFPQKLFFLLSLTIFDKWQHI